MKSLYLLFFGNKDIESVEEKMVNVTFLAAIVMNLIGLVVDYFTDINIIYDIFFILFWISSFLIKDKYPKMTNIAFTVLVYAFIPYLWITSQGSLDTIVVYPLLFIAIICVVTKGKFRLFLCLSFALVELLLIGYDNIRYVNEANSTFIYAIFNLGMVTVGLTTFLIYFSNVYRAERKRSMIYAKAIEGQNRNQLYFIKQLEELNDQMKLERHDFNNQLGVVYSLLESEEYRDAADYTKIIVNHVDDYRQLVMIPYPAIKALINYKLSYALKNKAKLDVSVKLGEGLQINEFDFTTMLSNLLDNAIEALRKVDEKERLLQLKIYEKMEYIVIHIENSYSGEITIEDGDIVTSKEDGANHGYGLINVKEIVDKYDGFIEIDYDDNIFKVDVGVLSVYEN